MTSVCTFSCRDEYHLVGSESISCDDFDHDKVGKWSQPAPICFRKLSVKVHSIY